MSATPLWTVGEISGAVDGTIGRDLDPKAPITSVVIDSRQITPGALFIAIAGERFDGHDFVDAAIEQGAAAVLVHKPHPKGIVCADTFGGLENLGKAAVKRSQAQCSQAQCSQAQHSKAQRIAVTGSVGKTGTKELLAAAFGAAGSVHATRGNLNNHFGVPLTLANMPRDTDTAVIEMGMSAPGEIRSLTHQGQPHVAIVTAIAMAHSEFFDSEAQIADAKAEIYEGLAEDGLAIYPADSAYADQLRTAAEASDSDVYGFGTGGNATLTSLEMLPNGRQRVNATLFGQPQSWELQMLGAHWARNSLAVALALWCLAPAQFQAGLKALAEVAPVKGRGNLVQGPDGTRIIDETYNASPAAMIAAIKTVGSLPTQGRRIAILGDMLELGETGPDAHRASAAALKEAGFDLLLGCGPLTVITVDAFDGNAQHFVDSATLAPQLSRFIQPHDLVLVKGSLGSKMALIVERLSSTG